MSLNKNRNRREVGMSKLNIEDASLMYVVCCVCKSFIDTKLGALDAISHTVCDECYPGELQKVKEFTQREHDVTQA